MARKAEPVHVDDVDATGTRGVSLFQLFEDIDVRAGDERCAGADQDDAVRGRMVARSTASLIASGTPALRAFTGGLSTVTTATRSRTVVPNQR